MALRGPRRQDGSSPEASRRLIVRSAAHAAPERDLWRGGGALPAWWGAADLGAWQQKPAQPPWGGQLGRRGKAGDARAWTSSHKSAGGGGAGADGQPKDTARRYLSVGDAGGGRLVAGSLPGGGTEGTYHKAAWRLVGYGWRPPIGRWFGPRRGPRLLCRPRRRSHRLPCWMALPRRRGHGGALAMSRPLGDGSLAASRPPGGCGTQSRTPPLNSCGRQVPVRHRARRALTRMMMIHSHASTHTHTHARTQQVHARGRVSPPHHHTCCWWRCCSG
eukprot:scaffold456_cov390-Prasinococcus_capsulatus_cf.AAC.6